MNVFSLLLFLIFNLLAHADEYVWIKSKNDFFSGNCYQVPSKDNPNYRMKVPSNLCQPKESEFVFLKEKGNCYEIDSKTKGAYYTRSTSISECLPEKTKYIYTTFLGRSGCYQVDATTHGEQYFKKTSVKKCKNPTEQYFFKWDSYKKKGKCFIRPTPGELVQVDTEECRTENTIFKFIKTHSTGGVCFEVDTKGANYYSHVVKIERCLPTSSVYLVFTPKDKTDSICLQVDEETQGEKYINKVKPKLCAK